MTAETSNARGEWVLVPREPTEAMIDAWRDAPNRWVEAYAAMLAAAPRPPAEGVQAGDGCHCGTCTCEPSMTPAVRFDLSPAQKEGAIREHLIRLGWTPPVGTAEDMVLDAIERRESSAPVGGDRWKSLIGQWQRRAEAAGYDGVEDALDALAHRQPEAWITPGGDVSRSFYWCLERCLPGQQPRPLYAAPQHPAAADGSDAQAAEIEALRAESAEAAKVLRGALDARTDGEPLRVLANRASNALYWRAESAERAKARAERLAEALRHQRWCRTCAEEGWESCEEGRKNDALLRDQED